MQNTVGPLGRKRAGKTRNLWDNLRLYCFQNVCTLTNLNVSTLGTHNRGGWTRFFNLLFIHFENLSNHVSFSRFFRVSGFLSFAHGKFLGMITSLHHLCSLESVPKGTYWQITSHRLNERKTKGEETLSAKFT